MGLLKLLTIREAVLIGLDYWAITSRRERNQDLIVPLVLAIGIIICFSLQSPKSRVIIEFITNHMGTVITALSILAGFNTTSMTMIAVSPSRLAKTFREKRLENNPKRSYMDQIMVFFSWAILVQLTFVLFSFILLGVLSLFEVTAFWPAALLLGLWLFGAIYSVTLTVRNSSILFSYLIAEAKNG